MKYLVTITFSLAALFAYSASSAVKSQIFLAEAISAISANGEWIICEPDGGESIIIRDLAGDRVWTYFSDGRDDGISYQMPITNGVSNNGTVVGEKQNVPSYWRPGADGKGEWTELPGARGTLAAIVGAITPDASMIVGSLSTSKSRLTRPCIWHLGADGSYGEPEFLPNPGPHVYGNGAMYINATSISDDGNTVGVSLRTGNGFYSIPYVYTRNEDGSWSNRSLGADIINPLGLEIPRQPSDREWRAPNYEAYMTPEELEAFYADSRIKDQELFEQGLSEEEIIMQSYLRAAEYMSEENAAKYLPIARDFVEAYTEWSKAYEKYLEAMDLLAETGADFEFNNVFVSPDGKYVYATAFRSIVENPGDPEYGMVSLHSPVRFDVATGEGKAYNFDDNVLISSVTADYSVLGQVYDPDVYLYKQAYIYPQNSTECLPVQDYFKETGNMAAFTWMEDRMYQEVLIGYTETGAYMFDDVWSVGKPVASPDMAIIGFACSTLYWATPLDQQALFVTAILNTANPDGIQNPEEDSGIGLPEVETVTAIEVYDLSGKKVYSGPAMPELSSGIYIVKSFNGENIKIKKIII